MMNDCKYGHDIHNGVMQLSLLRSPTYPNPEADQGEMLVTYSILLHEGALADSGVAKEAYYLNYPMLATEATGNSDSIPTEFSAVSLDKTNVICETVKQAERGEDTVIRMYEYLNRRTTAVSYHGNRESCQAGLQLSVMLLLTIGLCSQGKRD